MTGTSVLEALFPIRLFISAGRLVDGTCFWPRKNRLFEKVEVLEKPAETVERNELN